LVRIDPQQIKQVLINLVHNAADAVGERRNRDAERANWMRKRINDRLLDVVILEVTDTGKGISAGSSRSGCSIRSTRRRTQGRAWGCQSRRAS
jgi:nitrogen fixation/metabolism regulation signal transduction histidine kinase